LKFSAQRDLKLWSTGLTGVLKKVKNALTSSAWTEISPRFQSYSRSS
jgi:hypothetical protein